MTGCHDEGTEPELIPIITPAPIPPPTPIPTAIPTPTPIPSAHIFGTSEAALINGDATQARFSNPVNVEVATDGTVYVADFDNNAVRQISTSGRVTTIIQQSNFQRPFGLTLSNDGTQLFVETDGNDMGLRNATTGTIWRLNLATVGAAPEVLVRNIGRPRGLLYLPDGRIALSDLAHHVVTIFNPATNIILPLAGQVDQAGFVNGSGTVARLNRPYGMALSADGALLVADQNNNSIRKITLDGVVTTLAGLGPTQADNVNGSLAVATFKAPQDVAVKGNKIYVADHNNFVIRLIELDNVSTIIGNGVAGFVDAEGTAASFFGVEGFAITGDGKNLWLADGNNGDGDPFNRVRRLTVP
jgi:DNA-binding beta-propeller fold protein YncE